MVTLLPLTRQQKEEKAVQLIMEAMAAPAEAWAVIVMMATIKRPLAERMALMAKKRTETASSMERLEPAREQPQRNLESLEKNCILPVVMAELIKIIEKRLLGREDKAGSELMTKFAARPA